MGEGATIFFRFLLIVEKWIFDENMTSNFRNTAVSIYFVRHYWATGSAEELPPRIRANPRGYARTPPGSARIRRTSAKNIFRRTPPNVRRTFGGRRRTPRGYGRIRADSAANWRKSSLEKCPPTKTSLTPRSPRRNFRRGRPSAAEIIVGSGLGLGLGLWYSNPNSYLNPNPNLNHNANLNPNPNPNPNPTKISAANGRPPRRGSSSARSKGVR